MATLRCKLGLFESKIHGVNYSVYCPKEKIDMGTIRIDLQAKRGKYESHFTSHIGLTFASLIFMRAAF